MADLSILEWGVYGFLAYSSILMLIISVIKEVPESKAGSIARSIYLLPGAICAIVLGVSGVSIGITDTTNTITAVNTTEVWTESIASQILLINPIWITIHFLIFIVIVFYIITQIMNLLTKTN